MSDVSVTAASVLASATAKAAATGIAGETITAGQAVAQDPADSYKYKKADANSSTLSQQVGIALHGAANGQPLRVQHDVDDDFTPGFVVTPGEIYVLSATAGGIAPVADMASTMYPVVLMIGKTSSKVHLFSKSGTVAKS